MLKLIIYSRVSTLETSFGIDNSQLKRNPSESIPFIPYLTRFTFRPSCKLISFVTRAVKRALGKGVCAVLSKVETIKILTSRVGWVSREACKTKELHWLPIK